MPKDALPIISLFCGAGGLDWGFRAEGFRVLLACDNFQAAVNTYNFNSKKKVARIADLSTMSGRELNSLLGKVAPGSVPVGVVGGPPCQGFSRGNASGDPNDQRNRLPFRYAEILGVLNKRYQIKFFVFENVLGLLEPRHNRRFRRICAAFDRAGFTVFQSELDAQDFGVPQQRRRLFLVGLNKKALNGKSFDFPKGTDGKATVREALKRLPVPVFFERGLTAHSIPFHPNHWTMQPKSRKFRNARATDGRSFRRLSWDDVSPTVAYGNREIHVHPEGGRRLTVLEAMLLQGFPQSYRLNGNFSQQITQVSNAVPPPVARALARRIRETILATPNG